MEAIRSSETLGTSYRSTRRHNPEDHSEKHRQQQELHTSRYRRFEFHQDPAFLDQLNTVKFWTETAADGGCDQAILSYPEERTVPFQNSTYTLQTFSFIWPTRGETVSKNTALSVSWLHRPLTYKTNEFSIQAGVSLITRRVSALMRPSSVVGFTQLVQSRSQSKPVINKCIKLSVTVVHTANEFMSFYLILICITDFLCSH
jgi:hypothetical protein